MRGKEKTASAPKKESAAASKPFIVLPPQKNSGKKAPVSATTVSAAPAASTASSTAAAAAQKTEKPSTASAVPTNKKDKPAEAKKQLPWWKVVKPLAAPATAADKPAQNKANKAPVAAAAAATGAEKMLVSPETPWFEQLPKSLSLSLSATHKPVDARLLQEMQDAAKLAYAHEVSAYQSELRALGESTDAKWLNTVINSGTWSDKIAALALRVQESPFHNLEALDLLLGVAVKKDLRSAFMALEAVRDLLINNLLPDRPLRDFATCAPLLANNSDVPSLQLPLLCWYEAQLKTRIAQVHNVLQEALKANIAHFRRQGLEYTSELLTKKPEQEQHLLEMLVNKIGDSDGKISSKACELLKALLRTLPALKSMVVREVRVFIYRPNTKMTAIFTAVNFLTQVRLSAETHAHAQNKKKHTNPHEKARQQQFAQRTAHVHNASDRELALQLAECYLSLFEKATQAKEEGSRLLTVLLNGINRVFPFLTDQDKNHSSLAPYLDSIFRLVHTATSNATSTQALALLSQMVVASNSHTESENSEADEERGNSLRNRFYVTLYNKLLATDVFQHTKNTLFLNLLYKSVKADPNAQRAKAFVKRIAMCATECAPAMTAGLLFMISEILSARPELKAMLTSNDAALPTSHVSSSSAQGEEEEGDKEGEKEKDDEWFSGFNATKRNPLYALFSPSSSSSTSSTPASATTTPVLFEMSLLSHHVHPSVKAFAEALVHSPQQYISFQGDPLVEFSLLSFLHRFAYKNPKQKQLPSSLSTAQAKAYAELPMNEVFAVGAAMKEGEIAPEKHFFYKFFGERAALRAMGKSRDRKKKRGGDDDDDEDSDGERERDSDAEDGEGIDEEEEVDRFADKLADELMKHDARTRGEDFDEDEDFGDDLEDDDLEEDDDFEEEQEDAESDSDDSELVGKKSKKKGKASAAIDFEEFLQSQQGKKKDKKKAKKQEEDSDDDDLHFDDGEGERDSDEGEDDIAEPEAYLSDDDELMMMHNGDEEDDDEEPMFLQEDSDEEEEEEDVRGKNMKSKAAKKGDKKKKKRERAVEEDDDADDAFADASLFEDQMEEIVSKFKAESSAQKIANKMRKQQSKPQEEEKETATATKASQKKNKKRKLR